MLNKETITVIKDEELKNSGRVLRIENNHFFSLLKTYLEQGKKIKFNVSGNSMYPFVKNGDQVVLKPVVAGDIKKGRIVLGSVSGQFLLHRIVGFSSSGVILAGDRNLVQHETVQLECIWAVVTEVLNQNRSRGVQSYSIISLARIWYRLRLVRLLWFKLSIYLKKK